MQTPKPVDNNATLRRSIYTILICIGLGAVIGRILAVDSVDMSRLTDNKLSKELADKRKELAGKPNELSGIRLDYAVLQFRNELAVRNGLMRPFLSANDRSRWITVRALVEPEMRVPGAPYAIDKVIDNDPGNPNLVNGHLKMRPGWDTIDMVLRKVPVAGALEGHYYSSKPPLLATLMAAEYWVIYNVTHKSLGTHPYEIGRFMLITINGACLLLFFIFTARLVERLGTSDWGRIFVMAGCVFCTFLTTFAVTITNHLPAAACAAVLLDALVRIWFDGDRRTWTFIVAGFFSAMLAANEVPAGLLSALATLVVLCVAPKKTLIAYVPPAVLVTAAFFGTNWIAVHDLKPAQVHRGDSGSDNWYNYSGSYWNAKQGIDVGENSPAVYALHVLVGHHGVFSLTPIWLLFLFGTGIWIVRGRSPLPLGEGQRVSAEQESTSVRLRLFALLGLFVTLIGLGFYIVGHGVDRNYGGNASAFRWAFWMAPIWLVLMLPAADLMARHRWSRGLALVLLSLSAVACFYPTWNPWSPSWIMNFMGYMGWL
jgi:hypothetical protein